MTFCFNLPFSGNSSCSGLSFGFLFLRWAYLPRSLPIFFWCVSNLFLALFRISWLIILWKSDIMPKTFSPTVTHLLLCLLWLFIKSHSWNLILSSFILFRLSKETLPHSEVTDIIRPPPPQAFVNFAISLFFILRSLVHWIVFSCHVRPLSFPTIYPFLLFQDVSTILYQADR